MYISLFCRGHQHVYISILGGGVINMNMSILWGVLYVPIL